MEGKQRGVQSVSGCSRECHYFFLKYANQVNLHPQGCHSFESRGSSTLGLVAIKMAFNQREMLVNTLCMCKYYIWALTTGKFYPECQD